MAVAAAVAEPTTHRRRSRLGRTPITWSERYNEAGERRCTMCKEWKDRGEFGRSAASLDGLRIYCRACAAPYDREVRARQHERLMHIPTNIAPGSPAFWTWIEERMHRRATGDGRPVERYDLARRLRLCSCCYEWKTIEEFGRRITYFDGLSHNCLACNSAVSAAKRAGDIAFFIALDTRRREHQRHMAVLRQTNGVRKNYHKRVAAAPYLVEQPA